jgi:ferredoxin
MKNNGHEPGESLTAHQAQSRVAVLLSQRLASAGQGLDPAALRDWVQATHAAVQVRIVPDLLRRPGEIAGLLAKSGAERLVLVPAPRECSLSEAQTEARKAGLDPLGIAVLNLGTPAALLHPAPVAMERAKLLLDAAIAATRAYPGSRPEHLKSSFSVSVSRRALFTLAVNEYHAVPAVLSERCAAERGCQRCVEVCPQDAIRLKDLRIELSKSRCESCGICATACPTEAITFPGHSLAEQRAQIRALLHPRLAELGPRGILFVCRSSASALEASIADGCRYPAGWLPVMIPCAGSLSPVLALECLALGASAVGIAACRDQCTFRQGDVVGERVTFCQELLRQLGAPPERVRFCPIGGDPAAWALPESTVVAPDTRVRTVLQSPRAAAAALLGLAEVYDAPRDLKLTHPRSPYHTVELNPAGCTACEACVTTCPTGALASRRDGGTIAIGFDAALCTGCGLCVPRCPEAERGVLQVHPEVDLRRLAVGREVVYRDQATGCVACGAPIASTAMMARLAELLGDDYAALAGTIARYCLDCRGRVSSPRQNESVPV